MASVATAQVSRVEGSITDGAEVTVVGTNFGTKPNAAKPYAFFDFGRNQATASPHSRIAWGAPAAGVLTTDSPATNSQASWRFRIGLDQNEVYSGRGATRFNNPRLTGRDLYVFYRIFFNWDGTEAFSRQTDWNMKGFRIWAAGTVAPDIYMPGYPGANTPGGNPLAFSEGTNSGPLYPGDAYGIRKNQWKADELFLRQSSAINVKDGFFFMGANGRKSSVLSLLSRSSSFPNMYQDLFWHQIERLPFSSGEGKYLAYDLVYIDDSFARVMVTDRSTWDDTREGKIEIQIPVAWSNTSIQLRLRQGLLESLNGKFLYVFNANGDLVSRTGFPLGGKAPNPPSGFIAQ